jgi:hypothetical protein
VNPHELLHTPAHVAYHIDDGYVGEVYQEQELPISFVIKPGVALDSLIRYDVDVIVLLKQKLQPMKKKTRWSTLERRRHIDIDPDEF